MANLIQPWKCFRQIIKHYRIRLASLLSLTIILYPAETVAPYSIKLIIDDKITPGQHGLACAQNTLIDITVAYLVFILIA